MRSTVEVILSALKLVRADFYTKEKHISKDERKRDPTVPIKNYIKRGVGILWNMRRALITGSIEFAKFAKSSLN